MKTKAQQKKLKKRWFKDIEDDTEEYGYKIVKINFIVNSINEPSILQ